MTIKIAVLAGILGAALVALAGVPSPVIAGAADSLLTVDRCIARAVSRHPGLAAAADAAAAAAAVPDQRGAFPDPKLGFGYYIESPETRVGPMQYSLTLTQTLPFFGKRGMAADVAGARAREARSGYLLALIDLTWRAKEAYYEYYRLYNVRATLEEEKQVLDHMQSVAQVKYASGTAGQQDVLRAQLELSQVEDQLTENKRDIETVTARLVELLDLDPRATLPPPGAGPDAAEPALATDTADPDSLFARHAIHRPEIRAAFVAEERSELSISLAKRDYFPDLTLGVQYVNVGRRDVDVPDNGKDIWQVIAGINVPIWFGSRGAAVDEAEANRARARNDRAWVELRVRGQIRDALERVRAAQERVRLYEGVILPQARQAYQSAEAGYRAGTIGFLDYLDSERMLLSTRKSYHGVVADLGKQHAYLERVLGVDIRYADGEEG
jgi:outer membrane protein TolC